MNEIELRQLQFDLQNLLVKQAFSEVFKLMDKYAFFKTPELHQLQSELMGSDKDALFTQRLDMLVYYCTSKEIEKLSIAFNQELSKKETKKVVLENDIQALEETKRTLESEVAFLQSVIEEAKNSLGHAQSGARGLPVVSPEKEKEARELFLKAEGLDSTIDKIKTYTKSIELNPRYVEAYIERAKYLYVIDKFKMALQDCDMAISLEGNNAYIYEFRGDIKKELKMYNEAIIDYEYSIKNIEYIENCCFRIAECYSFMRNKEKTIVYLSKAIKLDGIYKEYVSLGNTFEWLWNDEDFKKLVE